MDVLVIKREWQFVGGLKGEDRFMCFGQLVKVHDRSPSGDRHVVVEYIACKLQFKFFQLRVDRQGRFEGYRRVRCTDQVCRSKIVSRLHRRSCASFPGSGLRACCSIHARPGQFAVGGWSTGIALPILGRPGQRAVVVQSGRQ